MGDERAVETAVRSIRVFDKRSPRSRPVEEPPQ